MKLDGVINDKVDFCAGTEFGYPCGYNRREAAKCFHSTKYLSHQIGRTPKMYISKICFLA